MKQASFKSMLSLTINLFKPVGNKKKSTSRISLEEQNFTAHIEANPCLTVWFSSVRISSHNVVTFTP